MSALAKITPQKNGSKRAANDHALYEFLPAAIEIEQTPSSKAGRMIIWAIVLLFSIAVLWACFGKVDIVAVAQGKIIPSDYSKQIQPLEAGKIKAIHVKEGQRVKTGDPLITLESDSVAADLNRLDNELSESKANMQRLQMFERWIVQNHEESKNNKKGRNKGVRVEDSDPFVSHSVSDSLLPLSQQHLLTQEIGELASRLMALQHEADKLEAEKAMVAAEMRKKERVIPVLKERVDALETLHKKSYGSKLPFLELKQELIEEEQDLEVQKARAEQLSASIEAINNQRDTLISEQRKQLLSQQQETRLRIHGLDQERIKTADRLRHTQLQAPINGQVQQLAVHTVGGVVTPAQALMVIVPENAELQVEAMILNKDIGFVEEGQQAEVKVDTFNFTKYGFIDGTILTISDDAIQDEHLGLVYSARIQLDKDELQVGERMVKLSPGMSVTTEVKTGTRRLIEYFLSPLLRYKQESLGER